MADAKLASLLLIQTQVKFSSTFAIALTSLLYYSDYIDASIITFSSILHLLLIA
jgi:hypothetical protein